MRHATTGPSGSCKSEGRRAEWLAGQVSLGYFAAACDRKGIRASNGHAAIRYGVRTT